MWAGGKAARPHPSLHLPLLSPKAGRAGGSGMRGVVPKYAFELWAERSRSDLRTMISGRRLEITKTARSDRQIGLNGYNKSLCAC